MAGKPKLEVLLMLNDKATMQMKKAYKGLGGVVKGFAADWQKHWLRNTALILGAGFAMHKFSKDIISVQSKVEDLGVRLKVLLGSVQEGNKVFEDMTELAGKVPKTYDEIMTAATDLAAVVKGGTSEINKLMPIIIDISAGTGIAVREVTSQMIRMYSAGAAAADMFRERGVLAALGFKAGVSKTAQETMEVITKQWEDGTGKYVGASKELAKTFTGMVSMMQDAWFIFRRDIGAAVFDKVKIDMGAVLELINKSKEDGGKYKEVVDSIGNALEGAYEQARNLVGVLVVGTGHAIDVWGSFSDTIQKAYLLLLLFSEKQQQFAVGVEWLLGSDAEVKKRIENVKLLQKEIEVTSAEIVQREQQANEDYSAVFAERFEKFKEMLDGMKAEIKDRFEEEKEIATASTEVVIADKLDKELTTLETLRSNWRSYQDERLAHGLASIQRETEAVKLAMQTQQRANQSMWVAVGKMKDQFASGISKTFVDMLKGTADIKEAFKDLGWQMVQTLVDFLAQKAINMAMSKVFQGAATAAATVTGAAMAQAYAPAAALASLASFGANAAPAAGALTSVTALSKSLAMLAEGGIVTRPTLAMVGERGPEAVIPLNKANTVASNNITINMNANIASGIDISLLAEELGARVERELNRARTIG